MKEPEIDKDDEHDLEKTQEELIVKAYEGDMLPLEQTWTKPEEDTEKQSFPSSNTFPSKLCSLLITEGNYAHDVAISQVDLPALTYDYSKLHKPKERKHSDFFLTSSKPPFKATHLKLTPFKEWPFNGPKQQEYPFPSDFMTIFQTH